MTLQFVDERLLTTPTVALMQVKKEMDSMFALVEENIVRSFTAMDEPNGDYAQITENERRINFINKALTKFLIKLSAVVEQSNEKKIGAYFHVLNDLERIGDHAENFYEIAQEMQEKTLVFSGEAKAELRGMCESVTQMFALAKEAFDKRKRTCLKDLTALENQVDDMQKTLTANHFTRLAEGRCHVEHSPYYSSLVVGLERVADHLVNVGYSIVSPTGSQSDN